MNETKICRYCGEEKPLDQFGSDKSTKDGLNHWCRECVRITADKNKKEREEGPNLVYVSMMIDVLIDIVNHKCDTTGHFNIPRTLETLIACLDLDADLLMPILSNRIRVVGRSMYQVIEASEPLNIYSMYIDALMQRDHPKEADQAQIDFPDPDGLTVDEMAERLSPEQKNDAIKTYYQYLRDTKNNG